MSIREQLRGVIRRSRDMADVAGGNDDDDDEYSVHESEKRVSSRSGVSPTGRTLQDLMKEQQSHMWAAEERHRKEYLPLLDEAIRAVGGDPSSRAQSGGSGAASYSNSSSSGATSPARRFSSSALGTSGGGGDGSAAATPRTPAGTRINPILNRSPSQSPESTSLGLMLMRPGGSLPLPPEGTAAHPSDITETIYTHTNRSSLSNSALESSKRRGSSPRPPPPCVGSESEDETNTINTKIKGSPAWEKNGVGGPSPSGTESGSIVGRAKSDIVGRPRGTSSGESDRGGASPCVSYRSATPPPPKLLTTTPPPTPKGSFYNLKNAKRASPSRGDDGVDLVSADSTQSGPPCDALDSTQRPTTQLTSSTFTENNNNNYKNNSIVNGNTNNDKGGSSSNSITTATAEVNHSNRMLPLSSARPPSSSSSPASSPTTRSPRVHTGGVVHVGGGGGTHGGGRAGGVLRPTSGSTSASIGGIGPSMSLKDMMADRNKDLSDAERRRNEEYIPLRDAAIREIEELKAEGLWRSK